MGDSFFGTYARERGRASVSRAPLSRHSRERLRVCPDHAGPELSRPRCFVPIHSTPTHRDPWWSLLVFYNSIRELGGAKTLFDSDIRSRLKFIFNRENFTPQDRRNLRIVEELTSRLSQAEIVGMMDRLSTVYTRSRQQGARRLSRVQHHRGRRRHRPAFADGRRRAAQDDGAIHSGDRPRRPPLVGTRRTHPDDLQPVEEPRPVAL